MRLIRSLIALLVGVFHCELALAQQEADVSKRLETYVNDLAAQNLRRSGSDFTGRIGRDERRIFVVQLTTGVANVILAACGPDCDHIEVSLFDYQHNRLIRSADKAPIAMISGMPVYSGLHEVEIVALGCASAQCEIGWTLLKQELPIGPGSAALAPTSIDSTPSLDARELTTRIQRGLTRVGCDPGDIDGAWGPDSKEALSKFRKYAGQTFSVDEPSSQALDAIDLYRERVCPEHRPEASAKSAREKTTEQEGRKKANQKQAATEGGGFVRSENVGNCGPHQPGGRYCRNTKGEVCYKGVTGLLTRCY